MWRLFFYSHLECIFKLLSLLFVFIKWGFPIVLEVYSLQWAIQQKEVIYISLFEQSAPPACMVSLFLLLNSIGQNISCSLHCQILHLSLGFLSAFISVLQDH